MCCYYLSGSPVIIKTILRSETHSEFNLINFTLKDEHSFSKWRTYIFVISHFNQFKSRKNVCTKYIFLIYSYIQHWKLNRKSWSIIYGCPTIDRNIGIFIRYFYIPLRYTLHIWALNLQSNAQFQSYQIYSSISNGIKM